MLLLEKQKDNFTALLNDCHLVACCDTVSVTNTVHGMFVLHSLRGFVFVGLLFPFLFYFFRVDSSMLLIKHLNSCCLNC